MRIDNIVEALIFAADAPLKPEQILEVLNKETFEEVELTEELLAGVLVALTEKYATEDFPFELRQIDGGYQFFTKRIYYPYVRHAAVVTSKKKLSRSSLETLAIIAYRQPVTKPEVEYIRGVNCDHAIQKLLEKKLIEIKGRADAPGKPLVYATSPFFMEYFHLNTLADLPKLQEFSINEEEYKKQFENYMAEQERTASDEEALQHIERETDGDAHVEMHHGEDPETNTEIQEEEGAAESPSGQEEDSAEGAIRIQIKEEDEENAGKEKSGEEE